MNKDLNWFLIGWLSSICAAFLFALIVVDSGYYLIPKSKWKCSGAYIINDDPSNTECNVYKLKEDEKPF